MIELSLVRNKISVQRVQLEKCGSSTALLGQQRIDFEYPYLGPDTREERPGPHDSTKTAL